jgi:hypothetical protein
VHPTHPTRPACCAPRPENELLGFFQGSSCAIRNAASQLGKSNLHPSHAAPLTPDSRHSCAVPRIESHLQRLLNFAILSCYLRVRYRPARYSVQLVKASSYHIRPRYSETTRLTLQVTPPNSWDEFRLQERSFALACWTRAHQQIAESDPPHSICGCILLL